jgi:hypothetical protein
LLHAILTLHEQIRTGAITRRREGRVEVPEVSGWVPEIPDAVRLGTPK